MTLAKNIELLEDPLDTVEMVASIRDWTYERSDNEVSIIAKGQWSDYQISVTWVDDFEGINIVCGFDLKFQERHKNNILHLVSSINNQMWLGHFDIWIDEGIVLYRNTSLLIEIEFHRINSMKLWYKQLHLVINFFQPFNMFYGQIRAHLKLLRQFYLIHKVKRNK